MKHVVKTAFYASKIGFLVRETFLKNVINLDFFSDCANFFRTLSNNSLAGRSNQRVLCPEERFSVSKDFYNREHIHCKLADQRGKVIYGTNDFPFAFYNTREGNDCGLFLPDNEDHGQHTFRMFGLHFWSLFEQAKSTFVRTFPRFDFQDFGIIHSKYS